MRYGYSRYMNDPEEGETIFKYLQDPEIEDAFREASLSQNSNIYLGSFLSAFHKDELIMWRTYGRDENGTDGGGCSFVGRQFAGKNRSCDRQTIY